MPFDAAERAYLVTQGIPVLERSADAPSDPTIPPWLLLPPGKRPPLRVLTEEDLRCFAENGYLIVRNAVPRENLERTVDSIWKFLEMDPKNPEDWYRPPLDPRRAGMVECYHSQELWDNRQCPRVFGAFADLFGSEKLWVSIDRCNVKLPVRDDMPSFNDDTGRLLQPNHRLSGYSFRPFGVHQKGFSHWDLPQNIRKSFELMPFCVQGVLSLTDTDLDMGGFICAPGHTAFLRNWITSSPSETRPDMSGVKTVPIATKAGYLIIWSRLLFHGNGRNLSRKVAADGTVLDPGRPRMAQYVQFNPEPSDPKEWERLRKDRIDSWKARVPPAAQVWAKGDPRGKEAAEGKAGNVATLTPLGKKILGMERWSEEQERTSRL